MLIMKKGRLSMNYKELIMQWLDYYSGEHVISDLPEAMFDCDQCDIFWSIASDKNLTDAECGMLARLFIRGDIQKLLDYKPVSKIAVEYDDYCQKNAYDMQS